MTEARLPPLVLLSFDRPHYLRRVLADLRAQRDGAIEHRPICFFQDGGTNLYSGRRYASEERIDECVELFRETFPGQPVFRSPVNLGICENFYRAERYVFDVLDAEVAYFFEDDLELSPYYVQALDRLEGAVRGRDDIGYFSACGNHLATRTEQLQRRHAVRTMGHHWGFGLKRTHWREMTGLLQPYFDLVVGHDYRQRDHEAIFRWFDSKGLTHPASSQDGAKSLATSLLGRWRMGTFACWGRYIGATGVHFTPEFYDAHNFAGTAVMDDPLGSPEVPDRATVARQVEAEREVYLGVHRTRRQAGAG